MSSTRPPEGNDTNDTPESQDSLEVERPKIGINLALEGGGVKGIALVGAIQALEEELEQNKDYFLGSTEARMVGTSAGAIVSTLFAAGYTSSELKKIIGGPEIARFADRSWFGGLPVVGNLERLSGLLFHLGMYKGDYFTDFIRELLREKKKTTFRDFIDPRNAGLRQNRYRLRLVASDITRGRMLILPDDVDSDRYGYDPDDLDVALAVRMSMSVPFVFRPVRLKGRNGVTSFIVDGGLLSNFPIRLFDRPRPGAPEATIGIRLLSDRMHQIRPPFIAFRAAYALASTAQEAHDISDTEELMDLLKWVRVVQINTTKISPFKFELNPFEKELLYVEGYRTMTHQIRLFLEVVRIAQKAAEAAAGTARTVERVTPVRILREHR
ncbi:patatin-like phospholipase family protein [Sorangium sp. So ce1000]|uniref:patatin-like phospholipase family protein n=1 Tax=Sorangium sp. So ce1000 TaxID=3133325 RepID=UPI003F6181E8